MRATEEKDREGGNSREREARDRKKREKEEESQRNIEISRQPGELQCDINIS